ncbi:HPr family phosphocarrier protein [Streptomyces armeniacus]|uniref:Phosphocarrier protein HPr n=1 Tax=Streptomyces armeniacus TaxID=83291 RepID=A0A345XP64_9ACTN|nr:HPr family phosphocarrier protein [Streptomyces armeniacus]AXK33430.1 HPr family phosphocarrier protein [Streptomyces armeniacus]
MSASSDTAPHETAAPRHESTVVLPADLHARPAGKLAQAAGQFSSAVELDHDGRTVNPTGVLAVMALGATAGSTVVVRAEGADAEEAVATLAGLLATAE